MRFDAAADAVVCAKERIEVGIVSIQLVLPVTRLKLSSHFWTLFVQDLLISVLDGVINHIKALAKTSFDKYELTKDICPRKIAVRVEMLELYQ